MSVPVVTLGNGNIPVLGFGTWRIPRDLVGQAIKDAIEVGYRHIDCAQCYENEEEIGIALEEVIKQGIVKRNDLFITSKLWNTHHDPDTVEVACNASLNKLKLTYLDNYLIHFPFGYKNGDDLCPKDKNGKILFSDVDYIDTWRAMEKLVKAGLCHNIGLSNFNKHQIERVLAMASVPPSNLQIECHPYLNQRDLMLFCTSKGIITVAYSPLGSPHSPYEKPGTHPLLKHPKLIEMANKYEKSVAQILLHYQTERGNIVITRSLNKKHLADNLDIFNFHIEEDDNEAIDKMDIKGRFNVMIAATGHRYHPFEKDNN